MGQISKKCIGIVGARALPDSFREQVYGVVRYLLSRDYHIHTGGALGADLFALQAVVEQSASSRGLLLSAWSSVAGFPRQVQPFIERYIQHRGRVSWGIVSPSASRGLVVAGLLARNQRLVRSALGIVAFMYGESLGTVRTIREAIRLQRRVVVFLCGGGAVLPIISSGHWVQLHCSEQCWGGAFMFRP